MLLMFSAYKAFLLSFRVVDNCKMININKLSASVYTFSLINDILYLQRRNPRGNNCVYK